MWIVWNIHVYYKYDIIWNTLTSALPADQDICILYLVYTIYLYVETSINVMCTVYTSIHVWSTICYINIDGTSVTYMWMEHLSCNVIEHVSYNRIIATITAESLNLYMQFYKLHSMYTLTKLMFIICTIITVYISII